MHPPIVNLSLSAENGKGGPTGEAVAMGTTQGYVTTVPKQSVLASAVREIRSCSFYFVLGHISSHSLTEARLTKQLHQKDSGNKNRIIIVMRTI